MLQQRVRQSPDRAQIQRRAGLQFLRKHADAAFADAAAETEGAADADVGGGTAVGTAAGCDARGDAAADGDGLGLGDADDVVAVVVGGRVSVGVGPDGVAKGLDDSFGGLVVPGGSGAKAGAAAVDAEGCGGGVEEEGDGGDADDGVRVVHFDGVLVGGFKGVGWVWFGAGGIGLFRWLIECLACWAVCVLGVVEFED